MQLSDHDRPTAQRSHSDSSRGVGPAGFTPGTGRRLQVAVGGLVLLLLTGFLVMHFVHVRTDKRLAADAAALIHAPTPVEAVTAKAQTAGLPLTLPGETAAWYESTIYARVSGYVGSWKADIGDHVKQGQTLATIETPELDAALTAAKAKLRAADADVTLRQAEANFASTTYDRWRDSPKGVVSEQEREDKKAQFESAQARLVAAQAQVNVDQAEVSRINAFEEFKHVSAPFDGTVTERRIDIGNLVAAGGTSQTTLLYRMAQIDQIRIFVDIPQSAASDLMKIGVPADITVKDLAGRHFSAKVSRTSQAIDPRTRTFKAEIDLPNPDSSLLPGMYVEVSFALASSGSAQVPASAMVFRQDGPHVALLDADNKVHFVAVTIARDEGTVIELGSGVKPGDKVVVNVSNQINDGDAVALKAIDGKPVEAKR